MENSKFNLYTCILALVVGFGVGVPLGMNIGDDNDGGGQIVLECDGVEPGVKNGQFITSAEMVSAMADLETNKREINEFLVSNGSDLSVDTTRGGKFNRCLLDSLLKTIPATDQWLRYRFGLVHVQDTVQTCLYLEGGESEDGETVILSTGYSSFCPTVCDGKHDLLLEEERR